MIDWDILEKRKNKEENKVNRGGIDWDSLEGRSSIISGAITDKEQIKKEINEFIRPFSASKRNTSSTSERISQKMDKVWTKDDEKTNNSIISKEKEKNKVTKPVSLLATVNKTNASYRSTGVQSINNNQTALMKNEQPQFKSLTDGTRYEKKKSEDTKSTPTEQENMFFQAKEFEDGYQFGDVAKTVLGTGADIVQDVAKGLFGIFEGVADVATNVVATVQDILGFDEAAKGTRDFANLDISQNVSQMAGNANIVGIAYNLFNGTPEKIINPAGIKWDSSKSLLENIGNGYKTAYFTEKEPEAFEHSSVSGKYVDSTIQLMSYSLGLSVLGGAATSATGVKTIGSTSKVGASFSGGNIGLSLGGHTLNLPMLAITGGMASGLAEANSKENVSELERWTKAFSSGIIEGATEGAFGFLGVGGSDITEKLTSKLLSKATTKAGKVFTKLGVQATGETAEEFLSYLGNFLVDNGIINHLGDADFSSEWDWGEVLEQMALAFVSTGVSGGASVIITTNEATKEAEKQLGRKLSNEEKATVTQAAIEGTIVEKLESENIKPFYVTEFNEDGQVVNIEQTLGSRIENPNPKVNASPVMVQNADNTYSVLDGNTGIMLYVGNSTSIKATQENFNNTINSLGETSIKSVNSKINEANTSLKYEIAKTLPTIEQKLKTTNYMSDNLKSNTNNSIANTSMLRSTINQIQDNSFYSNEKANEILLNVANKFEDVKYENHGKTSLFTITDNNGNVKYSKEIRNGNVGYRGKTVKDILSNVYNNVGMQNVVGNNKEGISSQIPSNISATIKTNKTPSIHSIPQENENGKDIEIRDKIKYNSDGREIKDQNYIDFLVERYKDNKNISGIETNISYIEELLDKNMSRNEILQELYRKLKNTHNIELKTKLKNENGNLEDILLNIDITLTGLKESFNKGQSKQKYAIVPYLDTLIKTVEMGNGYFVLHDDKNREAVRGYYYLFNTAKINGELYAIKIDIKRTKVGDRFYVHRVKLINKEGVSIQANDSFKSEVPVGQETPSTTTSIPQQNKNVKDTSSSINDMRNGEIYSENFNRQVDNEGNEVRNKTQYKKVSNDLLNNIDTILNSTANRSKTVKVLEKTPLLYQNIGMKNLPFVMTQDHIRSTVLTEQEATNIGLSFKNKNFHGLGKETLLTVINNIDNPMVVYQWKEKANNKYGENDYIIITQFKDKDNNRIIVPLVANKKDNNYIIVNKIKSTYGKSGLNDYLKRNLENGNIKQVYTKKRIKNSSGGIQYSSERISNSNITNSITQNAKNVKDDTVSINDMQNGEIYSKYFYKDLEIFKSGKYKDNDNIRLLDETPQYLYNKGYTYHQPIVLNMKKLETIMKEPKGTFNGKNQHGITMDIVEQLPIALNNPLNVIKNPKYNNRFIVVTELTDQYGDIVIVPLEMNTKGYIENIETDVNKVSSIYGKEFYDLSSKDNIDSYMEQNKNNIVYDIDTYKNKSNAGNPRLQLSSTTNITNITNSIPQSKSSVNSKTTSNITKDMQKAKNNTPVDPKIQKELHNRIQNSILSSNSRGRTYLGDVSTKIVKMINKMFGIDVSNRRHVLADNDIRHIIKQHGNPELEKAKGQIAITTKDIEKIPEIINNYDDIVQGSDNKQGKSIRYIKSYNNTTTYVVEVVPDEGNALKIKTMWKKSARVSHDNNNVLPYTSKTKPSLSSSTSTTSISQELNSVKNGTIINQYLKAYDTLTADRISMSTRNVIIQNEKQLNKLIKEALTTNSNKALHLGLLDETIISKIKKNIQNLPKAKQDFLNKNQYDLVINQAEIRHLIEYKNNLTEEEIKHFINILPEIISNSDYISYTNNLKDEGLRFKKLMKDGTYVSFILVSNKQNTMKAKTIYMEKEDFENKKRSMSLSNDVNKTPDNTSKTNKAFASTTSIPQELNSVKNGKGVYSEEIKEYKETSRKHNTVRNKVVEINTNIFEGISKKKQSAFLNEYLKTEVKGKDYMVSLQKVIANSTTIGKIKYGETKFDKRIDKAIMSELKANVVANLDDIIKNSKIYQSNLKDSKSHSFADYFDRRISVFKYKNQYYNVMFEIGKKNGINTLYSIEHIKKTSSPTQTNKSLREPKRFGSTKSSLHNVSQKSQFVKSTPTDNADIRYMKKPTQNISINKDIETFSNAKGNISRDVVVKIADNLNIPVKEGAVKISGTDMEINSGRNKNPNIVSITNLFKNLNDENAKEFRAQAIKEALEKYRDTDVIIKDTKSIAEIKKQGIEKTFSKNVTEEKIQTAANIKKIIEEGIYKYSTQSINDETGIIYHHFFTPVKYKNQNGLIRVVIKEYTKNKTMNDRYYYHQLEYIDNQQIKSEGINSILPRKSGSKTRELTPSTTNSISQNTENNNTTKKNSDLEASKTNAERVDAYIEQEIQRIEETGNWDDSIPETKRSDIVKFVEDYLDTNIKTGHFSQQAYGIYKMDRDIIRTRELKDLDTLFHEMGHMIDNHLSLDKSNLKEELITEQLKKLYKNYPISIQLEEGFAEFVREYYIAPERAKIDYSKTVARMEDIMRNDISFKNFSDKLKNMVYNYIHQTPDKRSKSNISFQEDKDKLNSKNLKKSTQHYIDVAITLAFDENYALRKYTDILAKQLGKANLYGLKDSENPYIENRLRKGISDSINDMLENGIIDLENGERISSGLSELNTILKNESMSDFINYIVSLRALEANKNEKKTGIRFNDAQYTVEKYKDNNNFQKARKVINDYNDALLEYAKKSGLYSQEQIDMMKEKWLNYVPFFRVIDKLGNGNSQRSIGNSLKKMVGSDRDIINPLEGIITNTVRIVGESRRNEVIRKFYNLGEKVGCTGAIYDVIPSPIQKVAQTTLEDFKSELERQGLDTTDLDLEKVYEIYAPQDRDRPNELITSFKDNGKRIFLQFNKECVDLYKIFTNMNQTEINVVEKFISVCNTAFKWGTTAANISFTFSNLSSDTQQAGIMSEANFIPFISSAKGVIKVLEARGVIRKGTNKQQQLNKLYSIYKQSGASSAGRTSTYRKEVNKQLTELLESKDFGSSPSKAKKIIDGIEYAGELSEEASRFENFVLELEKALKDENYKEAVTIAAFNTRNVTQDFSLKGSASKYVNIFVPYFSAKVGGMMNVVEKMQKVTGKATEVYKNEMDNEFKLNKTIKEAKKEAKKKASRIILKSILTLIALFSLNAVRKALFDDDERIEELSKQKKHDNYVFPDPFSKGVIVIKKAQGPIRDLENILEFMQDMVTGKIEKGKEGEEFVELIKTIIENNLGVDSLSGLLPPILKVPLELGLNKDLYYGTEIVKSNDLKNLKPEDQYYEYTTELSIMLGEFFGVSPTKIDFTIRGLFGQAPFDVWSGISNLIGLFSNTPAKADLGLSDDFILKKFFVNSYNNSESVDELYKLQNELKVKENYNELTISEEKQLKTINESVSTISKINKQIKAIKVDTQMSSKEKGEKILELQEQRTDVARNALGKDLINNSNSSKIKSSIFFPTQKELKLNNYSLILTEDMKKEYEKLAYEQYSKYVKQKLYSDEYLEKLKSKCKEYAKKSLMQKYRSQLVKVK